MSQPTSKPEEKPVKLTPEELAALDEGIRSAKEDPIRTLDEAVEFARKRRKLWMKPPAKAA
jgi:hypothetical protein